MLPFYIVLPVFLIIINIVSCLALIVDRQAAANGRKRISPSLLMMCVAMGGGLGVLLAVAPGLRDRQAPPLNPTMLTVIGLQVGIAVGIFTFFVLPSF